MMSGGVTVRLEYPTCSDVFVITLIVNPLGFMDELLVF